MVDVNLSEEEQVEALKKWWKENGRSVIGGVVLGLGLVFGWQWWNGYQQGQAAQASLQFDRLNRSLNAGHLEMADQQAVALISEYQGTTYADFAALVQAKAKYAKGDVEAALADLRTMAAESSDASLAQIARLRLIRILLAEGQLDEAQKVIEEAAEDSFSGEFAELRGDLALARGDRSAARSAYRQALDNQVSNASLVQMKLDELGGADSSD